MKKRNTTYRLNKVDYAIFIIFSIAAGVMLYLFYSDLNSFSIKQTEEPVAKIYFKRNTAQRKFIDNDIWEVLTNSSDIYDGDRIRTSKDSEAYTEFSDSGIQIQLREKSMVQIFKNKKQRSVNFIGGEIFVANNSQEEKLVIHSGKKEIAVSQATEVKIALPEVSEEAAAGEKVAEESSVIVEVVSGQVEIKEEPLPVAKSEKKEPEPIIVSAGETVTLAPVVEKTVAQKVVSEPVVETPVAEELVLEEPYVDENIEELSVVEEAKVEAAVASNVKSVDSKKSETASAAVSEPATKITEAESASVTVPIPDSVPEPVAEETPVENAVAVNSYVKPEDLYEPVEYKVQKTTTRKSARFRRNDWYDIELKQAKYNYYFDIRTSEVVGTSRKIPKDSTVLIELSGVPNRDLRELVIEMTTGSVEWTRANAWMSVHPDYGRGLKEGQPFYIKRYLTLTSEVVNTNISSIGLCYDPDKLDEGIVIEDFEVKVTVLPIGVNGVTSEIPWKFTKTLNYDTLETYKDVWGKGSRDYSFRVDLNGEAVFGNNINIPKGKKLKVNITGVTDKTIQRFRLELFDNTKDDWTQIFMYKKDNDYGKLNFSENPAYKGKKFNYTKTYTIQQELLDSNVSKLSLIIDNDGLKEPPVFTDLEINFVLE